MGTTKLRNTQILDGSITNQQIAAAAGISTAKLADGAKLLRTDAANTMAAGGSLDMNGRPLYVADPTTENSAAPRSYVDAAVAAIHNVKEACRVLGDAATMPAFSASYDNLSFRWTLVGSANGVLVVDGVTLAVGDRVLVNGYAPNAGNGGIFFVTQVGDSTHAWRMVNADDFRGDADTGIKSGMSVFVTEGTTYHDTGWMISTDSADWTSFDLGTTQVEFVQFSKVGAAVQAGAGLVVNGSNPNTIDVSVGSGLQVLSDAVSVKLNGGTLSADANGLKVTDGMFAAASHSHAHGDLSGVGPNDHHAQQHALVGSDHTATGLTTGQFLKALSATTFGFAAHGLGYSDVGAAAASHTHNPTNDLSSAVPIAKGGTGATDAVTALTNLGAVAKSAMTTKGDILAASAASTPTRVGVGSNGQVLIADSTQTAGVKWGVPTAGNADTIDSYHAGNASGQVSVSNGTLNTNLNADMLDGQHAGNGSGQIAISNGTVCTGLNADKLDGSDASAFAAAGHNHDSVYTQIAKWKFKQIPTGSINGSNATFALAATPVGGSEHVFLNGQLLNAGSGNDYTISGATITMLTVPQTGDALVVTYLAA